MHDAKRLMEAIDRVAWETVSLRLCTSGAVHAGPATIRDIERNLGEARIALTQELDRVLNRPLGVPGRPPKAPDGAQQ